MKCDQLVARCFLPSSREKGREGGWGGEWRRRCSKKRGYLIARERAKGKKKEGSTKTAFADSTFSIGSLLKKVRLLTLRFL